jgi:hypothetical protein
LTLDFIFVSLITLRHPTLGMTPLDDWSAHCRDLYLITCKTYKGETSMPPAGFELRIPASEKLQTYTLDCVDTGVSNLLTYTFKIHRSTYLFNFQFTAKYF